MAVRSRKFGSFYRRECGHRVQNARRSDGGNPVGTRGLLYNIKHSCTPSKERRITRWEHEHVLEAVQRRLDELHLMRFAQTITRCGLAAATKSLAIECAKAGIRVNPVAASRTTGVVLRGTESLLTHRWRELDSNHRSRLFEAAFQRRRRERFVADSSLEQRRFELLVPPSKGTAVRRVVFCARLHRLRSF